MNKTEILKELIEMAEDGYKLHISNGSHQEFLHEDREVLREARKWLDESNVSPQAAENEKWKGFELACDMIDDMGYNRSSGVEYMLGDCLRAKFNRIPKNKMRKNPYYVPAPLSPVPVDNCKAMGHYGGSHPDGKCPNCGENWTRVSVVKEQNPFACYGNQRPHAMDFEDKEEFKVRLCNYENWEADNNNPVVKEEEQEYPNQDKNFNGICDIVGIKNKPEDQDREVKEYPLFYLSELIRTVSRIANKFPDALMEHDLVRLTQSKSILKKYSNCDLSKIPKQSTPLPGGELNKMAEEQHYPNFGE